MRRPWNRQPIDPRELAYSGVFGASGLLLPILFHAVHLGSIFMPMYLPLMALAFIVRPAMASLTALIVPFLSGTLTGMPPFYPPIAPIMAFELTVMAFCGSAVHQRWPRLHILVVLTPVLLLGRVLNAGAMFGISRLLDLPAAFVAGISFIAGWPGLLLMLLIIPPVYRVIQQQGSGKSEQADDQELLTAKQHYFDSLAPRWDSFGDPAQRREKLRALLDGFHSGENETVLDVGSGTGTLTCFLLEELPPTGRIISLDLSPGMVDVASAKVQDPRVTWLIGDAASTSLYNESIDHVMCYSTWPHFRHPELVAGEFFRLLKPDGSLHILHTEGRDAVNAIHHHAASAIVNDTLLPADEIGLLLKQRGFVVTSTVDTDDRLQVVAKKPSAKV
ncbi:MAG TPA: class I SAM-dependent methyltransferase [Bacteroidota bacterium]|nr:class I SAM-dependent methyltransferase [Bacteroidota bacterium]